MNFPKTSYAWLRLGCWWCIWLILLVPTQGVGHPLILQAEVADQDQDGLSDLRERWWCTNPEVADSDGDQVSDGAEVAALKAWMAQQRAAPPATGKPFAGWPPTIPGCYDDDYDSIPDIAETNDLGLNPNLESSDHDQFDDGQELFGATNCPGSAGSCGYGSLPPANTANLVLFPQMPSWVVAPGNHPFVAALPAITIGLVEDSLRVERVTDITTSQGRMTTTSHDYTTQTTNRVTSVDEQQKSLNTWQHMSKQDLPRAMQAEPVLRGAPNAGSHGLIKDFFRSLSKGTLVCDLMTMGACSTTVLASAVPTVMAATQAVGVAHAVAPDQTESAVQAVHEMVGNVERCSKLACQPDQPVAVPAESATKQQLIGEKIGKQDLVKGNTQSLVKPTENKLLMVKQLQTHAPQKTPPQPQLAPSQANIGQAKTSHTEYQETLTTQHEIFTSSENWQTATAVQSAHAADLRFSYTIQNNGTDFARRICEIAFNLYLGDQPYPLITYDVAPELGGDGCLSNIRPDPNTQITRASRAIPLTLEQMKQIDLGAPLRVEVERFVLSTEDYYAEDAANAGVVIGIDDGIDDGNQTIDTYVLPTIGQEHLLHVLQRYFPIALNSQGHITAIWTPEQRSDVPSWCRAPRQAYPLVWCQTPISLMDWWGIYASDQVQLATNLGDSVVPAGSRLLFRFNRDSDHDGSGDRAEQLFGTDPHDPQSLPQPELIAGLSRQSASYSPLITGTLSLFNTGLDDAIGVKAVMLAPDETVTILDTAIGGAGVVRAQQQIVIGSHIDIPLVSPTWRGSATPMSAGYYHGGVSQTYQFTVQCPTTICQIGIDPWSLHWSATTSGTLRFDDYQSPALQEVDAGVLLGFLSGTVVDGDQLSIGVHTPIDVFHYQSNLPPRAPYTMPLVVVSYNDAQGQHRFMLPSTAIGVQAPTQDLGRHRSTMLHGLDLQLRTTEPLHVGENRLFALLNNPSSTILKQSRLYLEVFDSVGQRSQVVTTTLTVNPGPTWVPLHVTTTQFSTTTSLSATFDLQLSWTDRQGTIIAQTSRTSSSFQDDPLPVAYSNMPPIWDVGEVPQGTLLQWNMPIANHGAAQLLTYLKTPFAFQVQPSATMVIAPADERTYQISLDTSRLNLGAFDQELTLLSSDMAEPLRTFRVIGMVTDPIAITGALPQATLLRHLSLSATTYRTVTLSLMPLVSQTRAMTVSVDIGNNGSPDWHWTGVYSAPAQLTTSDLAAPINSYLLGKTGVVSIPLSISVDPPATIRLTQVQTRVLAQPDLVLQTAVLSPSTGLREGQLGEVLVTITNQGNRIVDQGLIGVYADVPQWGEWLIGSVLITQLPPGATRSVRLPWNTSGYHGVARLILRADPYRRLDERNTQNNQLSFEIALQPPLIQVFVPLLRR